ncbi:MAG: glycoside hydrolase family 88 protein [Spirochaetes bacterium]|uniref:Glycoside hydrolase family 88 protein n=1 Tax=Candidatus Ornithospirochaeta stercoripullorum TaxID=2840899 RepID=A0A9D9H6R3_9SPIO|nr:glycoside hydrolase family 88 protein [Candidatus Ornithospirochaeta stercoripullorum]
MRAEITEKERVSAIKEAITIIRRNLPEYTYKCQDANSNGGIYKPIDNIEWTTGFWPGELWLSYLETGDEIFAHAAGILVTSFYERIKKHIAVDHHDMGFLYTPSCVAAWMIKRDAMAREAALMAADNLVSRFQEKGSFIQAWGAMGADDNYRYIIDCMLNLPLLYWATDETGDEKYRTIALRHTATCIANSFRPDYSSYHTFFMDKETGKPLRGETCQGYKADSSWARGQAWGVYGLALAYRHTGEHSYLDLFEKVSAYFMEKLPEDMIPYWDLIFQSGDEPRDSSSASIVACGFLDAADSYEKLQEYDKARKYRKAAKELLKAVYDTCMVHADESGINGLVKHGTYSKKSPYNTCTEAGVDECVSWGDYYWLEALVRLGGTWKSWW